MRTITVIFTCYNRKNKTIRCVESLSQNNPKSEFSYVILDDASTDGTADALEQLAQTNAYAITVLNGNGQSYWAGGMRTAMAYAKKHTDTAYYLMVNDDVIFNDCAIDQMVEELEQKAKTQSNHAVLVGATCNENGEYTYGGIRYTAGVHYEQARLGECCDTFNMNCVLVPKEVFMEIPDFDPQYIHGLADFDYGLAMKKRGITIAVAKQYVGACSNNETKGGWNDRTLSRRERLRLKENPKGAPFGPWFHFLKKNFGIRQAIVRSMTPYLRILLGK